MGRLFDDIDNSEASHVQLIGQKYLISGTVYFIGHKYLVSPLHRGSSRICQVNRRIFTPYYRKGMFSQHLMFKTVNTDRNIKEGIF